MLITILKLFNQIPFVPIVTGGIFSTCYDMNMPEEHPLMIR